LQINEEQLTWSDLVLSTGSHAAVPKIEGINETEFWTSDIALSQTGLPKSVAIVGGGPVGCELAQIYSSFGTETNLLEFAAQLVEKEHPLISKRMAENLAASGVSIYLNTNVVRLEKLPEKQTRVHLKDGSAMDVERVILATGRKPTTSGFNVEVLELEIEENGAVKVDNHCRALGKTNIWAAGDVTGIAPYTHTANYQGQIVVDNITNVLRTASYDAIPRAIYTNPPVVSVGKSSNPHSHSNTVEAQNEIANTARFLTDGGSDGLVILVADLNDGILIGASAIGPNADDWMSEVVLAIHAKIPISVLAEVVHGFPTFGEVLAQPLRELAARCNA
jgi:pyruvate/2-oxoglutarate dehydrogenase complex dihydrolipoamide dehydrogenase (E3) component